MCSKFLGKEGKEKKTDRLICSEVYPAFFRAGFSDKRKAARSVLLKSLEGDYKIDLLKNVSIFREAFILDSRFYVVSSKVLYCKLPVWQYAICAFILHRVY